MNTEVWKQIPGAKPGYEASSEGRIRDYKGTIRPQWDHRDGYLLTKVHRADGGWWQSSVHSFVALAFHGPRPDGMEVAHGDHNKHNNRPDNLRYATKLENANDGHPRSGSAWLPWSKIEIGQSFVTHADAAQAQRYAEQNGRRLNRAFAVETISRREQRITRRPMLGAMTCQASATVGGDA